MSPRNESQDRRPRTKTFEGEDAELLRVLRDLAVAYGKSFLRYEEPEDGNVSKAKTDEQSIANHHHVAKALFELYPALLFSHKQLERVLSTIVTEQQIKWGMTDPQCSSWTAVMSLRIRSLCHVVHAADSRNPKPDWAKKLPWNDLSSGSGKGSPAKSDVASPSPRKGAVEVGSVVASTAPLPAKACEAVAEPVAKGGSVQMIYGWSATLGLAYRHPLSRLGRKTQTTSTALHRLQLTARVRRT